MEKLIEDAIVALNSDRNANIASQMDAHLSRIDPNELVKPLLAVARFRAYLAERGLNAAARSLAELIRRQRVRLPAVRTSMLERSGEAWHRFSSSGDPGVPTAAAAVLAGGRIPRQDRANLYSFGIAGDSIG